MRYTNPIGARGPALALFLVCGLAVLCLPAAGQDDVLESTGSILKGIARSLNLIGEKTQEIIAPRFSPLGEYDVVDFSGKTPVSREFTDSFPVRPGALLSLNTEFGEVRISTWDDPVVQVRAEILAGAETFDVAQEIARGTNITVNADPDQVEIRTQYPDTRDLGHVAKEVNYVITVPQDIRLSCRNNFGDIVIEGIRGEVAADAQFGVVDLRNLAGPVRVRARGELPLFAYNLEQGGAFDLRGTQAEFNGVAKELRVSNFLGSVLLAGLPSDVDASITCDSGPVTVLLAETDQPTLEAFVLFGSLRSDISLNQSVTGDMVFGRSAARESEQRIAIDASFADVSVRREQSQASQPQTSPPKPSGELMEQEVVKTLPYQEGQPVVIDAIAGDVRVEGTDGAEVKVTGTRTVQMIAENNAMEAAEALSVGLVSAENKISVTTAALQDMLVLGCTAYRVDLVVECPRSAPLTIKAAKGQTVVQGMSAPVKADQTDGAIRAIQSNGGLELTAAAGGVEVLECGGTVTVNANRGAVTSRNVDGPQTITAAQGDVVVDAPRGALTVRHRSGNVRIIPLDGILGNYDAVVEGGTLSILVPEEADATILATARNGLVRTAIPLTGEIGRGYQKFQGRPREGEPGAYQVVLETRDGDIVID